MLENELFEQAPVHKAYFKFALPVVFSMVVSLVYNMVDTYFIAQTGNTNLVAGVSLGAPIFTLMIALGDIFGLGGSPSLWDYNSHIAAAASDSDFVLARGRYRNIRLCFTVFYCYCAWCSIYHCVLYASESSSDRRICNSLYDRNHIRSDC